MVLGAVSYERGEGMNKKLMNLGKPRADAVTFRRAQQPSLAPRKTQQTSPKTIELRQLLLKDSEKKGGTSGWLIQHPFLENWDGI